MVIIKKYYKRSKKYKWSKENLYAVIPPTESEDPQIGLRGFVYVVPASLTQGMRCAKNFSITFSAFPDEGHQMIWALVYVPATSTPSEIGLFGDPHSVYEPNQHVIMCGLYDPESPGTTSKKTTRLARNLNSGDSIALVYRFSNDTAPVSIQFTLSYAVCYK